MSSTRIRITSDGTPRGTKVTTEDGTLIKGVQAVTWTMDVSGFARAQVEILAIAADVVGLVETDGSVLEDPTAVPLLTEPQDAPDGPGFPGGYPVDDAGIPK